MADTRSRLTSRKKSPSKAGVAWGSDGWKDDLGEYTNITFSDNQVRPQRDLAPQSGIAHWTFNDSETDSSTLYDVWGNHNGTLHSITTGVDGRYSDAYQFDGSGYVDFDRSILPELSNTSFSIAVRVYRSGTGTIIGFISNDYNDYILLRENSEHPNFRLSNGLELNTSWTDYTNQWVDIVMAFSLETNSLTLYIENEIVNKMSISNASPLGLTGEQASVGRYPTKTNRHFHGLISDLRLYNKALSPVEVDRLYHSGSIIS